MPLSLPKSMRVKTREDYKQQFVPSSPGYGTHVLPPLYNEPTTLSPDSATVAGLNQGLVADSTKLVNIESLRTRADELNIMRQNYTEDAQELENFRNKAALDASRVDSLKVALNQYAASGGDTADIINMVNRYREGGTSLPYETLGRVNAINNTDMSIEEYKKRSAALDKEFGKFNPQAQLPSPNYGENVMLTEPAPLVNNNPRQYEEPIGPVAEGFNKPQVSNSFDNSNTDLVPKVTNSKVTPLRVKKTKLKLDESIINKPPEEVATSLKESENKGEEEKSWLENMWSKFKDSVDTSNMTQEQWDNLALGFAKMAQGLGAEGSIARGIGQGVESYIGAKRSMEDKKFAKEQATRDANLKQRQEAFNEFLNLSKLAQSEEEFMKTYQLTLAKMGYDWKKFNKDWENKFKLQDLIEGSKKALAFIEKQYGVEFKPSEMRTLNESLAPKFGSLIPIVQDKLKAKADAGDKKAKGALTKIGELLTSMDADPVGTINRLRIVLNQYGDKEITDIIDNTYKTALGTYMYTRNAGDAYWAGTQYLRLATNKVKNDGTITTQGTQDNDTKKIPFDYFAKVLAQNNIKSAVQAKAMLVQEGFSEDEADAYIKEYNQYAKSKSGAQ